MSARGHALFEAHACFRCHEAARAEAGVVPVPLVGLAAKYDVERLAGYLAAPQPPMPVFPLGAEDRRDLAVYLLARRDR